MPTRREFLWPVRRRPGRRRLAQLLGENGLLADAAGPRPEFNGGLHHPAKVKRVIQLFMNGGVSQPDTFDYKPELAKTGRQAVRPRHRRKGRRRDQRTRPRDEEPLRLQAARPVRPLGQLRLPALGRARR